MEYDGKVVQISYESVQGHLSYTIGVLSTVMEHTYEIKPPTAEILEGLGETTKDFIIRNAQYIALYPTYIPDSIFRGLLVFDSNNIEGLIEYVRTEERRLEAKDEATDEGLETTD